MIEMPLSLTEAAGALRDGAMTSAELTTAALGRADALDPGLGVYVSRLDAQAMDSACRADADFAAGRDRSPLQGIPVGLEHVAGDADVAAIGPSPVLDPAWVAEREPPAVARIRRAGAVITGRLSTSGTGVGVAAGLFLAGLGPDTGGSARHPATFCGISGLVPTSGRVPVGCSRDHVTPLARSVRDCAAVLGVIAPHHQVLVGGGGSATGEYLGTLCGSLAGVRLGVDRAHDADDFDPAAAGLVDDAVAVLGNLGADVVEVILTSRAFAQVDGIVGASRNAQDHDYDERPVLILPMGTGRGAGRCPCRSRGARSTRRRCCGSGTPTSRSRTGIARSPTRQGPRPRGQRGVLGWRPWPWTRSSEPSSTGWRRWTPRP